MRYNKIWILQNFNEINCNQDWRKIINFIHEQSGNIYVYFAKYETKLLIFFRNFRSFELHIRMRNHN